MNHLILVPAYGRDYQTASQVQEAWESGKDFKILSLGPDCGRYINKQDAERYGLPEGTYIRYRKLTELTHIGVWEAAEEDEESLAAETAAVAARMRN